MQVAVTPARRQVLGLGPGRSSVSSSKRLCPSCVARRLGRGTPRTVVRRPWVTRDRLTLSEGRVIDLDVAGLDEHSGVTAQEMTCICGE
jgi:hypothetical protein